MARALPRPVSLPERLQPLIQTRTPMALNLITSSDLPESDAQDGHTLALANDVDTQAVALDGITHIALNFP